MNSDGCSFPTCFDKRQGNYTLLRGSTWHSIIPGPALVMYSMVLKIACDYQWVVIACCGPYGLLATITISLQYLYGINVIVFIGMMQIELAAGSGCCCRMCLDLKVG